MNYLNKITITALLGVGAVAVGAFLVWPKVQELDQVDRSLAQHQSVLENQERYAVNLTLLARELNVRQDQLAAIGAALPEQARIPAIFDSIQKMSITSGLLLEKIEASEQLSAFGRNTDSANQDGSEFVPVQPVSQLKVTPIHIDVTGSYTAFLQFVDQLRTATPLSDIVSIEVSKSASEEESGRLLFEIEIEVFSY
jgi:Tfp pilus assembly protein PilO